MRPGNALLAGLLLIAAIALAGCSSGGGYKAPPEGSAPSESTSAVATVIEKDLAFEPSTLEVKVGDTVTFQNQDSVPHNVSIDGRVLGVQNSGASVTWKATTAGSFPYTCTIHPSMAGEIVVK